MVYLAHSVWQKVLKPIYTKDGAARIGGVATGDLCGDVATRVAVWRSSGVAAAACRQSLHTCLPNMLESENKVNKDIFNDIMIGVKQRLVSSVAAAKLRVAANQDTAGCVSLRFVFLTRV